MKKVQHRKIACTDLSTLKPKLGNYPCAGYAIWRLAIGPDLILKSLNAEEIGLIRDIGNAHDPSNPALIEKKYLEQLGIKTIQLIKTFAAAALVKDTTMLSPLITEINQRSKDADYLVGIHFAQNKGREVEPHLFGIFYRGGKFASVNVSCPFETPMWVDKIGILEALTKIISEVRFSCGNTDANIGRISTYLLVPSKA